MLNVLGRPSAKTTAIGKVIGKQLEIFVAERPVRGKATAHLVRFLAGEFQVAQDGCDNHCTFCITTLARGASVSRLSADVLGDIRAALVGGAQEIVLTGVHLGAWGLDIESRLSSLIKRILDETDTPRLRLSSLEPWDLDEEFSALWEDPRLCPHLHLPIQSGSTSTLKRMLRKTTPDSFRSLVEAARRIIPGVAITTDILTGFPGETEVEFLETLDFIREMDFAGGHIFTYSARPGTPAARMRNQPAHARVGEWEQHAEDEIDGRRGALDVEQDEGGAHARGAMCIGPRQTGSKPRSAPLSV